MPCAAASHAIHALGGNDSTHRMVWRSISGSLIGLPPELTLRSFRSTWIKSDALIMPTTRAVLCG